MLIDFREREGKELERGRERERETPTGCLLHFLQVEAKSQLRHVP